MSHRTTTVSTTAATLAFACQTCADEDLSIMSRDDSNDDFLLAEAHIKAEATQSSTPLIKEELRYKIQQKRRDSGQGELLVEQKNSDCQMTAMDLERLERRRASNRKASRKLRLKNMAKDAVIEQNHKLCEAENVKLTAEVQVLTAELRRIEEAYQDHLKVCPLLLDTCGTTPSLSGSLVPTASASALTVTAEPSDVPTEPGSSDDFTVTSASETTWSNGMEEASSHVTNAIPQEDQKPTTSAAETLPGTSSSWDSGNMSASYSGLFCDGYGTPLLRVEPFQQEHDATEQMFCVEEFPTHPGTCQTPSLYDLELANTKLLKEEINDAGYADLLSLEDEFYTF